MAIRGVICKGVSGRYDRIYSRTPSGCLARRPKITKAVLEALYSIHVHSNI